MPTPAPSSLSRPPQRGLPRDQWLAVLRELVQALSVHAGAGAIPPLAGVLAAFTRLVQASLSPTTRLRVPWTLPGSLLANLRRLADRTRPRSAAAWERAVDTLLTLGEAGGLIRDPRPPAGRQSRRLAAVDLRVVQGWRSADLLTRLWSFALTPAGSSLAAAEERYVVSAVLMTVVESHLTFPGFFQALASATDHDLSFPHGVLTLALGGSRREPQAGQHRQRFPLDLRSRLLWGRLRLFYTRQPPRNEPVDHRLLGAAWRDPSCLQAACRRVVEQHGLGPWRRFVQLVRADGLLWHPPCGIAYRAGAFRVAPAPALDCQWVGWTLQDDLSLSRMQARSWAGAQPSSPLAKAFPASTARPTKTLHETLSHILRPLHQDTSDATRREMAAALEEVAGGATGPLAALPNPHVLARYAAALLRDCRRYKAATVRTWLSGLWEALDGVLGDTPLGTLTAADDLLEVAEVLLASCASAESKRVMRQRLKHLCRFLAQQDVTLPPLNWRDPLLVIPREARTLRLLGLAQIRAVVEQLLQSRDPEGLPLAVAVILGGFGGLRRSEMAHMRQQDVAGDTRGTLFIWRSKTLMGKRYVPLGLLAPPWAREVVTHYGGLRSAGKSAPHEAWLLTAQGQPWAPATLTDRLGRVLQEVAGPGVSVHSLRRACASWLLVRWVVAVSGIAPPCADPCFAHAMQEQLLTVLPPDPVVGLWGLARLLGHLDPDVTLTHYVGTFDYAEGAVSAPPLPGVSYREAAALLQCSDPQARHHLAQVLPPLPLLVVWEGQRMLLGKVQMERRSP